MSHDKCFAGSFLVRVFLGKRITFIKWPILIRTGRDSASHCTHPSATKGNIDRIEWYCVGNTNLIVLYITFDNRA